MGEEKKFSIKAVLIGLLVDVIGSTVAGFVFAIIVGVIFMAAGVRPELLYEKMMHSLGYFVVAGIIGFFFTGLGGYVAARMAKMREL